MVRRGDDAVAVVVIVVVVVDADGVVVVIIVDRFEGKMSVSIAFLRIVGEFEGEKLEGVIALGLKREEEEALGGVKLQGVKLGVIEGVVEEVGVKESSGVVGTDPDIVADEDGGVIGVE